MDSRRGSSQASDSKTAFDSSTFDKDVQIRLDETVGSASISPSGRDVVLASREGLHIIDLDSPYSQPRYVAHRSPWEVADVQWSPFASRDSWIVSTSNQKALVWNLNLSTPSAPIEHTLHAHSNAITDINFSAHHADILATCAVDSYVHCWDLRKPAKPVISFAEWFSGATQVKWNRQDSHIIASSHQRKLLIWDDRKGAYPLKEIEAHSTQIYGIDWNRLRPEALLTCSLDRTIKLWDYTSEHNVPERVIRTSYPVWRARHTPFGRGILAMPKRYDFNLHLYDRRLDGSKPRGKDLPPVHSFGGHTDQVKEFLWRSRGGIQDGADKREFQLVSWGTDRVLRLHKIEDEHLEAVGHHRGAEVHNRLTLTRAGATYRSFRDESPRNESASLPRTLKPPRASGLLGWSLTQKSASQNSTGTAAPKGMQARRRTRKIGNAIDWMGGVKMGKDAEGGLLGLTPRPSIRPSDHQVIWDTPDSLSDEITYVGKKFKKVNFEQVDINKRSTTVTLNGPWGTEGASVFVRVTLRFPSAYPIHAVPQYIFEKTTSAVTDKALGKIRHDLRTITDYFGMRRIGSLEAIIMYLLGERDLDESLKVFPDPTVAEDSSSEDDDDDEDAGRMDMSGSLGSALVNASVPLPKGCGAYFAEDGRLICFFPPKPEPKPLFDLAPLREAEERPKGHRLFDELGPWRVESPEPKDTSSEADATEEEDDSSEILSNSSASSSSDTSDILSGLTGRFKPLAAWGAASTRLQKTSQHSSSGQLPAPKPAPAPKSYISIVDTRDLVPSKKQLAEDYQVFGDGPSVCANNAAVALQHNLPDLAHVWELLRMILFNQVPLEILAQTHGQDPVLVVAQRAASFRKNRDGAVNVATDDLHARVKWGAHPLANRWLIPRLFEHFEKLADVQMLAMMSCVLAEPVVRQPAGTILKRLKQQDFSMPMKCPAFSLNYFASQEVALAFSRAHIGSTALTKQDIPTFSLMDVGTVRYGSEESSNGPWGSDRYSLGDLNAPYSVQSTPPKLNRATTRLNYPQSLSTSPEKHLALRRATTSSFAASLVLPKSYANTAAGTPPELRFNNDEADLSTSAPASAVTWGDTTVFTAGGLSPTSQRKSRSSLTVDGSGEGSEAPGSYDFVSDEDSDLSSDDDDAAFDSRSFASRRSNIPPSTVPPHLTKTATVRLTVKNQELFDEEAHGSVPLLDPKEAPRFAAYRAQYAEQLAIWGLAVQHSEVLKFNGLVAAALEQPMRVGKDGNGGGSASGSGGLHSRNGSRGTQRNGRMGLAGVPAESKRHRNDGEGQHALGLNCKICWQVIVGLHVRCSDCGIGRAHRTCADPWVEEFGRGEPWCECGAR